MNRTNYSIFSLLQLLLGGRGRKGVNTVRIWGGLGNQMFQYAFGQMLARNTGGETVYDVSWFGRHSADRTFGLGCYSLVLRTVPGKLARLILSRVNEAPENIYNPDLLKIRRSYVRGYFQVARYYEGIRTQLLEDFRIRDLPEDVQRLGAAIASDPHSVSLHVRRGDYIDNGLYFSCDEAYYTKAVRYIINKTGALKIYVFSDDLPWVKANIKLEAPMVPVVLPHEGRPELDMYLMSQCHHNIIANSTFSWWGAWLNQHPDKIVVAPRQWISKGKVDIVPAGWVRL